MEAGSPRRLTGPGALWEAGESTPDQGDLQEAASRENPRVSAIPKERPEQAAPPPASNGPP